VVSWSRPHDVARQELAAGWSYALPTRQCGLEVNILRIYHQIQNQFYPASNERLSVGLEPLHGIADQSTNTTIQLSHPSISLPLPLAPYSTLAPCNSLLPLSPSPMVSKSFEDSVRPTFYTLDVCRTGTRVQFCCRLNPNAWSQTVSISP
jgi:hypothetical protein